MDSNVISMSEYKRKKKKPKKTRSFEYTGKLADALHKYGSDTGNVMKDQHKKKDKTEDKED